MMPLETWARRHPGTRWPLVLLAIVLLIGLAGGITGCGGGDCADDERDAGAPPVDCKLRPELCQ